MQNHFGYVTRCGYHITSYFQNTRTQQWLYARKCHVTSNGAVYGRSYSHEWHGVRPVLKTDNLDELIKNCKSEIKNGVQIVEYGEYPHLLEKIKIYNSSYLRKTGKTYILVSQFGLEGYPEYDYKNQKVVKVDNRYYPVKPIKFCVDRKNSMLISIHVLFNSPITGLHHYLNCEFKACLPGYENAIYINCELLPLFRKPPTEHLKPKLEKGDLQEKDSIQNFTVQDANKENIDDAKKSSIERIDNLLRINSELQATNEALVSELKELKDMVKGKQYVRK